MALRIHCAAEGIHFGNTKKHKLCVLCNRSEQMRTDCCRCEQTADANTTRTKLRLGQYSYGTCLNGNTKKLHESYEELSAGPKGAHGCAALWCSLVSFLSRHHAISCEVPILLSRVKCYSSSIAEVLRRIFWFLCSCLLFTTSHGHV